MTDLELCKKIAEIDNGKGWLESMYADKDIQRIGWKYNPLTDKALLWDAMVKYEVDIIWTERIVQSGCHDTFNAIAFGDNDDLPRAILECIVEAHK